MLKRSLSRRALLKDAAGAACFAALRATPVVAEPDSISLKQAAASSGRLVGVFSGNYELKNIPGASQALASNFDMLAVGNDVKMNRIQPNPGSYDFSFGDWDLDWTRQNNVLLRGHTLIWHDALPSWFKSYVNKQNARKIMTDHITTVMSHYRGKMYSWDVVNEPIRNADGRPDGLRTWPWLELVGPDYMDVAFRTAASADPDTKLILNECFVELDLPLHAQRRDTLVKVLGDLKKNRTPIHAVGIQSHLQAHIPIATSQLKSMLEAIKSLGLEIMITEFDVDDTQIYPDSRRDQVVADKYREYLEVVGPYVKMVSFQQLADPAQAQDTNFAKRADGLTHRPNLLDSHYQTKAAYVAVAQALGSLPRAAS